MQNVLANGERIDVDLRLHEVARRRQEGAPAPNQNAGRSGCLQYFVLALQMFQKSKAGAAQIANSIFDIALRDCAVAED